MPSMTKPMCPTDENAISRFRSFCARHASAAYTIPITASSPIHGAYFCAPYGSIGSAIRMNPYVPIFSMTPGQQHGADRRAPRYARPAATCGTATSAP